jgi:hypothetical protein
VDSGGRLYLTPSAALIAEKQLSPVRRDVRPHEVKAEKIGRNAPCACGSGVKFKKCCYGKSLDERLARAFAAGNGKAL